MRFQLTTIFVFAGFLPAIVNGASGKPDLRLWYSKPASQWEETLPLGNGRLGMTPDGGIDEETIVLNDITLWSGAPQDANNYEAGKKLPEIRQLLVEGKNDEAQRLIDKDFVCLGKGGGDEPFGCFQNLGNLRISYLYDGKKAGRVEDYYRELDLNEAIARTSFTINGVRYQREYFTSFGDDVDVIRISSDKKGMVSCRIRIDREERATVSMDGLALQMEGELESGTSKRGMRYLDKVQVKATDGKITAGEHSIQVENATELLIFVSAGTDFKNPSYKEGAEKTLEAALSGSYQEQKKAHIEKFQSYFKRVNVELGTGENSVLPTPERLSKFYHEPENDPGLAVLFYQFGRYLSISSTRPGLLPPNLQGLWAHEIHTPWNGDYHLDVNVQMNHWPVEVSNLPEMSLPLAELVKGMVPHGEKTAKAYYNADGWVAHVITNVWGFTEPGESASWGIANAGSGWVCSNLWDHYAFTADKTYLKEIYPVLKGSAQFYRSVLVKDPQTGWLVTAPSVSPENAFVLPGGNHANVCMGPTIDNQIIRELFGNVIAASELLKVDEAFREELRQTLKLIPPTAQISESGRIQEWLQDYKETDLQHRHLSHLYGLYPAPLITPEKTPELAEAAKKTLNVRGDDGPSWTIAYKVLFWARLHEGNRAFKLLREILKPTLATHINYGAGGGVYPNMLSAGPPFQIDGNFGATAGIAEMLIQSHAGFIHLIPAIPDLWKKQGKVSGLKARGNFTVDMEWKDGKVTGYSVSSPQAQKVKVKVNGEFKEIISKKI